MKVTTIVEHCIHCSGRGRATTAVALSLEITSSVSVAGRVVGSEFAVMISGGRSVGTEQTTLLQRSPDIAWNFAIEQLFVLLRFCGIRASRDDAADARVC